MNTKNNLTVRLDDALRARLDHLAERLDRTRAWIVTDSLHNYLDHHSWLAQQMQKGADDAALKAPRIQHEKLMRLLDDAFAAQSRAAVDPKDKA